MRPICNYDTSEIQPTSDYLKKLLSQNAYKNASLSYTTKYVSTAINKARCPINCVTWEPNAFRLLTGAYSGELTLWNGFSFNFEAIVPAHDFPMRSMCWSRSEEFLVTSDDSGVLKYWTPTMNNAKAFQAHSSAIREISFGLTDAKFVTCSDDKNLKIWDFERVVCETTLSGHGWDVKCGVWHPDMSLIISGSKDTTMRLWDPKSGKCISTINGHRNPVNRVKFHSNGNLFVSASADTLNKIWDLRTMKEFAVCRAHVESSTALAFHPIHKDLFVSGGFDGHIFFWDTNCEGDVTPLASILHAHESATWDFAWHPLGHMLVSASNDYTTRFWTRNFPGDEMKDKYNVHALPAAIRTEAMQELAEIAQATQKQTTYNVQKPLSLYEQSLAESVSSNIKTAATTLPFTGLAKEYKARIESQKAAEQPPVKKSKFSN